MDYLSRMHRQNFTTLRACLFWTCIFVAWRCIYKRTKSKLLQIYLQKIYLCNFKFYGWWKITIKTLRTTVNSRWWITRQLTVKVYEIMWKIRAKGYREKKIDSFRGTFTICCNCRTWNYRRAAVIMNFRVTRTFPETRTRKRGKCVRAWKFGACAHARLPHITRGTTAKRDRPTALHHRQWSSSRICNPTSLCICSMHIVRFRRRSCLSLFKLIIANEEGGTKIFYFFMY